MAYKYQNLICAGTFDMLHEGHQSFILYAFSLSQHVYLTVTSDTYTARYKPHASSFEKRKKALETFLQNQKLLTRAEIIPIDDVYGITRDSTRNIDAVLVSIDTKKGAETINTMRRANGLSPLAIEIAPFLHGQHRAPISTTAIRKGIIDVSGKLFIDPIWTEHIHYLPQALREELQRPFGKLLSDDIPLHLVNDEIVTVGDITTKKFHDKGYRQKIAIIDFVVERKQTHATVKDLGFEKPYSLLSTKNPPGVLTPSLWQTIRKAVMSTKDVIIVVDGEEDLAVIPMILVAPLGYHIFYGQPKKGLVWVEVTLEMKKKAYALLKRFL